jgi:tetratricopeptide (TPR) repeat protein
MAWRKRILAAFYLFLAAGAARGQAPPAERVAGIQEAYHQLRYQEAERLAQEALERYAEFDSDQLAEIHTLLALVTFSQNRQQEARRQFVLALELNPDLALDPLLVSPKIRDFFEGVKQEQARQQPPPDAATIRYVKVQDPGPAAAMRSLVLPGWGQLHKGEATKGWVLVGSWGAAASGTAVAHFRRRRAEADYLNAVEIGQIEDQYRTFNNWHRWRNGLAVVTAGLWAYSYLDALVSGGRGTPFQRVSVAPYPGAPYAVVRFSWHF